MNTLQYRLASLRWFVGKKREIIRANSGSDGCEPAEDEMAKLPKSSVVSPHFLRHFHYPEFGLLSALGKPGGWAMCYP